MFKHIVPWFVLFLNSFLVFLYVVYVYVTIQLDEKYSYKKTNLLALTIFILLILTRQKGINCSLWKKCINCLTSRVIYWNDCFPKQFKLYSTCLKDDISLNYKMFVFFLCTLSCFSYFYWYISHTIKYTDLKCSVWWMPTAVYTCITTSQNNI